MRSAMLAPLMLLFSLRLLMIFIDISHYFFDYFHMPMPFRHFFHFSLMASTLADLRLFSFFRQMPPARCAALSGAVHFER
jgi:hypothetical protein